MSLTIVYFHGYGSSPLSDKVTTLRNSLGVSVFAFPADIDPDIAKPLIEFNIDMMLLDNMHSDDTVLFVGTSLGGWMAAEMAVKYDVPAIIINPACNPRETLRKYGVSDTILSKYSPIKFSKKHRYFFAENDEVIGSTDTVSYLRNLGYSVFVDPEGDHRFNGSSFVKVIDYIKKEYL